MHLIDTVEFTYMMLGHRYTAEMSRWVKTGIYFDYRSLRRQGVHRATARGVMIRSVIRGSSIR